VCRTDGGPGHRGQSGVGQPLRPRLLRRRPCPQPGRDRGTQFSQRPADSRPRSGHRVGQHGAGAQTGGDQVAPEGDRGSVDVDPLRAPGGEEYADRETTADQHAGKRTERDETRKKRDTGQRRPHRG
jgi:hypothetical protein